MAKSKNNAKKLSYISVPSQIINSISSSSLQSLLDSPKKSSRNNRFLSLATILCRRPRLWFLTLFLVGFIGMFKFGFNLDTPLSPYPCAITQPDLSVTNLHSKSNFGVVLQREKLVVENGHKDEDFKRGGSLAQPLVSHVQFSAQGPSRGVDKVVESGDDEDDVEKSEFWKQPDGLGYKPCLSFTRDYRRASEGILKNRKKYLMVVVSGGMNQQRNQIVDAVVIARILGAALVAPILQVNVIWGDERYILLFLSIICDDVFSFLLLHVNHFS